MTIYSRLRRLSHRNWCALWGIGAGLTWVGRIAHGVSVISFTGGRPSAYQLATAAIVPIVGTFLMPLFIIGAGMFMMMARVAHRASSPFPQHAEAFACAIFTGSVAAAIVVDETVNLIAGIIISFAAGQAGIGLYLPFTLATWAASAATDAELASAKTGWCVLAAVGWAVAVCLAAELSNAA